MIRPTGSHSRTLSEVAEFLGLKFESSIGSTKITGICSNSRSIEPGDLFLALPGESRHGIDFLEEAISNGAAAVLTDEIGSAVSKNRIATLSLVNQADISIPLCDWFFGNPLENLSLFGVTGTNGKTTTTFLLTQIFQAAGIRSGIIGTVAIEIAGKKFSATHTTPAADELVNILAKMKESSVSHVAIEVSSHALAQHRVAGLHFVAAGFTNLSQDHLDYHKSMENYFAAKRSLFTESYTGRGYVNIDNEYGARLINEIQIPAEQLSLSATGDWKLNLVQEMGAKKLIQILGPSNLVIKGETNLLGKYNLENLLLAVAMAVGAGIDPKIVAESLPRLTGAPGRLELVTTEPCLTYIDYAHTPDAVTRVLEAVRSVGPKRIIGVLGCGGDRDRTKRAPMGSALNNGCDVAIFTSDNPRSESPAAILEEMTNGLKLRADSEIILDRRIAIRRAMEIAQPSDLVIVLGKGHEIGQEVNGKKIPFNDREEILQAAGIA